MKTVIVLGLKNSGSGCIYDYLSSRSDFLSPFGSSEFKLCSDPMGIHNIYINSYKNFSFFNPSNSMYDFIKYVEKYQNYIVYPTWGNGKKLFKNPFLEISKKYIDRITKVLYFGNPEFSNFKINKLTNIYLKFKKTKSRFYPIRIPVSEKIFLKESKLFIKQIILRNLGKKKVNNKQNIVLNQASNLFDPIYSSQYFENSKIIIVTRDPRDIFSSMKMRESKGSPSYDVNLFCNWFLNCFNNLNFKKTIKNKKVLIVKFEDFVNDFNNQNKKICNFLNIKKNYKLRKNSEILFNLEESKKNLYKSKKFLKNYEYKLIEKKLKKYLHW
jgi:hypothetical protein